jgi:hypothetical protein
MKLYVFTFQGVGALSPCVMANTEEEARRLISEYIETNPSTSKYMDNSLIPKEHWPAFYDMEVYEPGQIAFVSGE